MKVKLGEVSVLINGDRGKNYPSQADILSDGDIPFVNAGHLDGRSIRLDEMSYITFEKYNQLSSGKFRKGDILYCLRGSLGKKAVVQEIVEGAIASSLVIIRPDSQIIDANYLILALDSPCIQNQLLKANNGSSQPNLSAASVRAYEIDLPNKKVQEEIVNKFDKIQRVIDARKQQLQKLDELVKARFVEMFGDPLADDMRYPKVQLGSLADVGSSKRIFEKEYVNEGIPFYRTKEIVELSRGNRITTELFITKERYDEIKKEYGVPQAGDLLISAVGTIGVIWIVDGRNDFYFKDGNLLRIASSDRFAPIYLKYLLEALIGTYKLKMSSGTAYAALTISALKEMLVYKVPLEEQNRFAAFVAEVDKSKLAVQQSLEKLETLKKSLMQQYFG